VSEYAFGFWISRTVTSQESWEIAYSTRKVRERARNAPSTVFCGLGFGFTQMVHGTFLKATKVLCQNMFLDFRYLARGRRSRGQKVLLRRVCCDVSLFSTLFYGLGLGFRPIVDGTFLEATKVLCKNMFLDF
jgi:hypothetical protein